MAENWIKPVIFNKKLQALAKPERALPQLLLLLSLQQELLQKKERQRLLQLKLEKITYQRTNYCTCPWAIAPAPTSAAKIS